METTFRLRADELDNNFISAIQQLFKQKTIEINNLFYTCTRYIFVLLSDVGFINIALFFD